MISGPRSFDYCQAYASPPGSDYELVLYHSSPILVDRYLGISHSLDIVSNHDWSDYVVLLMSFPAFEVTHYFCCSFMIKYRIFELNLF